MLQLSDRHLHLAFKSSPFAALVHSHWEIKTVLCSERDFNMRVLCSRADLETGDSPLDELLSGEISMYNLKLDVPTESLPARSLRAHPVFIPGTWSTSYNQPLGDEYHTPARSYVSQALVQERQQGGAASSNPPRSPPLPDILGRMNKLRPDQLQTMWDEVVQENKQKPTESGYRSQPSRPGYPLSTTTFNDFSSNFDLNAYTLKRYGLTGQLIVHFNAVLDRAFRSNTITLAEYARRRLQPAGTRQSTSTGSLLGVVGTEVMYASVLTPHYEQILNCTARKVNGPRLLQIIGNNRPHLNQPDDPIHMNPEVLRRREVQFANVILYRCIYINAFLKTKQGPHNRSAFWDAYYPGLGPNIELDCWIYEQGILTDPSSTKERFSVMANDLIRMYGFGPVDLRYLLNNHNEDERREQLKTLEEYHMLKIWLEDDQLQDLIEQMRFCYYAMRDSKCGTPTDHNGQVQQRPHCGRRYGQGDPLRYPLVRARRREFKIAKIMVNRTRRELLNAGRRISPVTLRQGTPRHEKAACLGDWDKLSLQDQHRLLGAPTQHHPEHPEYGRLYAEWF